MFPFSSLYETVTVDSCSIISATIQRYKKCNIMIISATDTTNLGWWVPLSRSRGLHDLLAPLLPPLEGCGTPM
jgi:hypothetical protein